MNFRVLDIFMTKSENLGFTISGNIDNYLRVCNIKMNGSAFEAGLQNGDCILMINDVQIQNRDDIINSLRNSKKYICIKVIRKNVIEEENVSISTLRNNLTISRRKSIQEGTLHRDLLRNIGTRVSMEISRASPKSFKNKDNRIQYFEKSINTNVKEDNEIHRKPKVVPVSTLPTIDGFLKSNSYQDIQNMPRKMNIIKNTRKTSQTPMKRLSDFNGVPELEASSSPQRFIMASYPARDTTKEQTKALSLREKFKNKYSQSYQSLSNISNFSKSYQNILHLTDVEYPRTTTLNNTSSMMSLFDDENINSHIGEYKIDWKAICMKISITTINEIEKELISYFTNSHTDLRNFPVNSMYRYVTLNGVLDIVFNNILSSDTDVDFHEEILKIPNEIYDVDYDMNSYNIINLLKHNVKRMNGQLKEYKNRQNDLSASKEKLKETLAEYLERPQDCSKMHCQIDRIYKIFNEISNFLTAMVIAMSMWKFSKDFSHLFENMNYQTSILTTSENMHVELRKSQKNLEKNIISLFRRFKTDSFEDVLKLLDQLFSETLDLSICIPLFNDKLKRDMEMLGHLENDETRDSLHNPRKIQYV